MSRDEAAKAYAEATVRTMFDGKPSAPSDDMAKVLVRVIARDAFLAGWDAGRSYDGGEQEEGARFEEVGRG